MNDAQRELWRKLEAFALDDAESILTFSRRLARENSWRSAYAQRVIGEYKRFVFLVMEAGHPVSPSEDVDQSWHLHLTYTESYWQDMCAGILGRRLHHYPTKGGADEARKFDGMYARTLDSYRRLFGQEPPADIWPPPERKDHAGAGQHRWIDLSANWVVPKKWLVPAAILMVAMVAGLLLPGCQYDGFNPFNLTGPEFLKFYFFIMIVGFVTALTVRHAMCGPHDDPGENLPEDDYEIAFLAGGAPRVLQTAVVALHAAGAVEVLGGETCRLRRSTNPPTQKLHDVEVLLWGCLPKNGGPATFESLRDGLKPACDRIAAQLEADGLLSPNAGYATAVAGAIAGLVPIIGLIKMIIGLSRGRPVGILAVLCIFSAAFVIIMLVGWLQVRRSGRGRAALRALHKEHKVQEPKIGVVPQALLPVGTATALFGLTVLPQYQMGVLADQLQPVSGEAWSTIGGSGCGSSCGGGGGCGGGCGGCGGGGD